MVPIIPENPYARIVGLLPLTILVGGLLLSGIERYMYGYHYDPRTVTSFSRDLRILNQELSKNPGDITLISSKEHEPFYQAVASNKKQHKNVSLRVATTVPPTATTVIVERSEHGKAKVALPLQKIITDTRSSEADRFYLYKNTSK